MYVSLSVTRVFLWSVLDLPHLYTITVNHPVCGISERNKPNKSIRKPKRLDVSEGRGSCIAKKRKIVVDET